MNTPQSFDDIDSALSAICSASTSLADCRQFFLASGCINRTSVIEHRTFGRILYKENSTPPPNFFLMEAYGLQALADHIPAEIIIPQVYAVLPQGILMEYLQTQSQQPSLMAEFGRALALFHTQDSANSHGTYGFEYDNYLGLTLQRNTPTDNWVDFFAHQRLYYQLELAKKNGLATSAISRGIERLIMRLNEILPEAPHASLLHGDLWAGNYMVTENSGFIHAAIIDPAPYRGHFEADLAMTELFGGFNNSFYQAYVEHTRIEAGYELRQKVYNLYHLLNHLNLFGASYVPRILASLRAIGML